MALDFGAKRTGIAVTDPLQLIASGLTTCATEHLLDYIEKYYREEGLDALVVGQPRRMDHSFSAVETEILEFITALGKRLPELKIEREDERFTSKMAADVLVRGGMKKKKRREKGALDQVSATLILQSYLSRTQP
ncbi:putative holliday junction resolvase [Robiginitalea myxolifaciens]|uniref:Putative pre-16S rRNA nuclease n=1 Tax=Robiginitalea myxolifaciens TaxID=400055 RepID=A0A1I6H7M6_9FLAO|nr:Holliday junction resolvase RuvX [Robiginitalea myxolifaciens]SFR50566.1 putative holliday junction resolvase [Robiginitalea myxolifaciens]